MLPSVWQEQRSEHLVIWRPLSLVSKSASKLLKDTSPTTAEISTVLILPSWVEQNLYKATKKADLLEKNKYHIDPILYFCKNSSCMNNTVFKPIHKRKFCAIFTANQTLIYQNQEIINAVKLMQLIFITQLRGVCKVNESKNRKNIMAVSIAIVVLGLGPRANCPLTTSKQRKKTGPSRRNL